MSADVLGVVQEIRAQLHAYMQFRNEVGALILRLVEQDDPAGLVLLELVRDLEARMGEFDVSEDNR